MLSARLKEEDSSSTPQLKDQLSSKPPAAPQNVGKSPYLQTQESSEIQWQLFDDEATSRAKKENKLIFLHVGYSASHHCHLTIQESFSNRNVIAILNAYFVPVLVDRDERPDLDRIYMSYIHSLNSSAGYPLNVFLTPELEPVFGGTYFPAPGANQVVPETGEDVADFLMILQKLQKSWAEEESRVRADGKQSVIELRKVMGEGTLAAADVFKAPADPSAASPQSDLDLEHIEEAYNHINGTFDHTYGGFVHMPPNASSFMSLAEVGEIYDYATKSAKFITAPKLSFLLKATQFPQTVVDVVGEKLSTGITNSALETLRKIADGGIHDHLVGGFHPSSATRDWSLPNFEKILPDNALALSLYLDAWLLGGGSKDGEFADIVFELADYLTTAPILRESGGFVAGEAADSPNKKGDKILRHGAYYLWTRKEFDAALGNEQESSVAAAYWDVREHGNVKKDHDPNDDYLNENVLRVVKSIKELSSQFKIPAADVVKLIESARNKLRAHRLQDRPWPSADTKVITAYNGMAIAALARTAACCSLIRGCRYVDAAIRAARFIKTELWDAETKTLYRMYCENGRSDTKAFAEDYAFLIEGLLELYETTANEAWLEWADVLQKTQIEKFYDDPQDTTPGMNARCGGFYCTTRDTPHILLRVKDAMDTTRPSDNTVSASNLFRLGALLDDSKYTHMAKETINAFEAEMLQYPYLFPGLLSLVVSWRLGAKRWVSVEANPDSLEKYHSSPRGSLWTVLHFKHGSKLSQERYPGFAKKLEKQLPGLYSVDETGALSQLP
ncbi:spermatogenesis-associated protein [Xylariales sp. PMI_506]|nr:spermatogenesis-associated protein [Xylariales sp. PMI_506]